MELSLLNGLRVLVATSIFFVWVVRYENILAEFKEYNLPDWLRDLVGILKMSFAVGLLVGNTDFQKASACGIAILMICAQATHLKAKTSPVRRLPSAGLLIACVYIFLA